MKTIYAQGYYCYIGDHGLTVGDQYHYDLSHIDFGAACKKTMLFIEAAKNSMVIEKPFLFMLQIADFSALPEKQHLYTCSVLFKPKDYPNSILVSINDAVDSSYSVHGHVPRNKAASFLDILSHDFLAICKAIPCQSNRSHIL